MFYNAENYNDDNYHTFKAKIYFFHIRVLKSKKKKLALISFYCLSKKHDRIIHENLFTETTQEFTTSFTWKNSEMFNITSKYFSIFIYKPPAS